MERKRQREIIIHTHRNDTLLNIGLTYSNAVVTLSWLPSALLTFASYLHLWLTSTCKISAQQVLSYISQHSDMQILNMEHVK